VGGKQWDLIHKDLKEGVFDQSPTHGKGLRMGTKKRRPWQTGLEGGGTRKGGFGEASTFLHYGGGEGKQTGKKIATARGSGG